MLVTNGTLNILFLLLNHLVGKDGTLLTEEMTYPNMQALSQILGFRIVGLRMDDHGLSPDALEAACREIPGRKVLYTIPTLQNPTATVMPIERRRTMADLARRYGLSIIEDDAQALMLEDAPPPIATFAPELTWYVMGLAKTVVMGLRVAYMAAPQSSDIDLLMARFGKMSMWFVAAFQAELVQALITSGIAHRATVSIRNQATARRAIVADVLDRPNLEQGPRGLHVFIKVAGDAVEIADRAARSGVLVRPGLQFAAQPQPTDAMAGLRVSFCETRDEQDLRRGLEILKPLIR